jgi:hypothetical protein
VVDHHITRCGHCHHREWDGYVLDETDIESGDVDTVNLCERCYLRALAVGPDAIGGIKVRSAGIWQQLAAITEHPTEPGGSQQ